MSRLISLIIVYLLTGSFLTVGFADDDTDKGDSEKDSNDSYEEFVGIDMSDLSKEELIPLLEGIELPEEGSLKVTVVPIKMGIGKPSLFLLRRSVKNALENNADVLVLDMDTPGGGVMEALE